MKKLKLALKALLSLSFLFFLVTCAEVEEGTLHDVTTYLFPESYRGEWIRMDTGENWYFAGKYWMVYNGTNSTNATRKTSLDKDMTLERQSQNVIKVTEGTGTSLKEYYLYASRIGNSTFEAGVVSDDASSSLLSIFSRKAINGIRDVKSNIAAIQSECDSTSKKDVPVDGNEIHVPDIISGDPYKITIDGYVFHVTPNTDGDNVGTLTLTNGVNFKASIVPKSSNTDLMCLYGGNSYDFIIKFTNVGNDYCTAMTYTFTTPNGITITKNEQSPTLMTKGDIQAIKPGDTKDINITIYCESISEDFEFKEIAINTVDLDNKTWEDSVSLKINKKSVTFNIKSNLAINGVVIVPSGKTYHFKTSGGWGANVFSAEIPVPKYMKDYLIVFSGASADTEAKYSFAVDKEPASDFDAHLLPELNIYWPNDTETNATPINYDQEIMAYLRMNKANYYKVRFTD